MAGQAPQSVAHFPGRRAERWISLGYRLVLQYIIKVAATSALVGVTG